jgi:alkylation response protein AidB-like acyl-CoA dehydrogenase
MSPTNAMSAELSTDAPADMPADSTDTLTLDTLPPDLLSAYLTDEHRRLRRFVRDFAADAVAPQVKRMESSPGTVETALPRQIAELGWIGATIPDEYGGMGAGHVAKTIIIEGLSRVSAAMGAAAQASMLGVAKLLHYGTDEQKQRWLPQIAAGSCLPTIAVTEPESGSHVLGMRTTAERDGDHYVLNGRKVYVGNAHIGHLHGVVARTAPLEEAGSRSLSAFLVEADRPGLTLVPHRAALGLRGFSCGELRFTNVRIPEANLLSEVGDGMDVAYSSSVLYGRPNLAAVALGVHHAALEEAVAFVKGRRRFGATLADLDVVKHEIGLMRSRLMTAHLALYNAAALLDRGKACDNELINAKAVNVDAGWKSVIAGMRLHGAAALQTDRPMPRLYCDIAATEPPAGPTDIQLLRLGQAALGQERRQWSQRLAHAVNAWRSPTPDPHPE